MPDYSRNPSTFMIDQVRYYLLTDELYTPAPGFQWVPPEPAPPGCDCWSCRDFIAEELHSRAEAISANQMHEHFTEPYIPFHPSNTYINATPEKEPMIPNPLPEPPQIKIYSRHNPSQVLHVAETATLVGYNFHGMRLDGANFEGLDLSNADFTMARLHGATLKGANVSGAIFQRANLSDTLMTNIMAEGANFTYANLDYSEISGGDFTGSTFTNTSFYCVYGTSSANFDSASFSGASGVGQCESCGDVQFGANSIRFCDDISEYRCEDCGWEECQYCDEPFADLYDHEDHCNSRRHSSLHEYDYRPYRYSPKGNFPAEPLMGVELEIGGDEFDLTSIVNNIDPSESHLYCKHDGSVDGIEVVTHPMTLQWAKQNFDFATLLTKLSQRGHSSDNYGIHVHVSRNAFRGVNPDGSVTKKTQPKHQMAWLMFMYRNADAISKIARRTSDNWASWRKPGAGELKRKAAQPDSSQGRYIAINCENDKTYEVRVFRSTLNFTEFMAAIELVDASVNYTRNLTTTEVLHNQAMSWGEFHKWCVGQGAKYSSLLNQMKVQSTL